MTKIQTHLRFHKDKHTDQFSSQLSKKYGLWSTQKVTFSVYPFPKQALVLTCLQYKSFENTVGKGEIARVFYPSGEIFIIFIEFETVVCKLFEFGRV